MYDLANKYFFCSDENPLSRMQAFMLLNELETFVNGAIIQANRLMRTRKSLDDEMKRMLSNRDSPRPFNKRHFKLVRLRLDYHFYFICIGQIHRLLKSLGEVLNDRHLKDVLVKFAAKFPEEIRHDLEHIDERAQGKKRGQNIGHITDFGNFQRDGFSFGGRTYTVNKETVIELKMIYEEILHVLERNYASKAPNFVRGEQPEKQINRILSDMKKWRPD